MRPESLKLFAKLMENGYITREQSPAYYEYYNDPEIASELAIMEQELYGGKGNTLQTRYYIKESDFLSEFTKHCEQVRSEGESLKNASAQYSIDFLHLADNWLAKRGDESNSIDTKHGCFMKIIRKFRDEELLYDADGVWKPTVKLNDLMPYYLSQTRITEIHSILEGGKPDASDP